MKPSVQVVIPWRPSPERMAAFERTMQFWNYVGWPVVFGDSPADKPFSLAQARNRGVAKTSAQIVVVSDADTIPTLQNVVRAVDDPGPGVTWVFSHYRRIHQDWVDKPDLMGAPLIESWENGLGGCYVCKRSTYFYIGGTDPRFIEWGFEDTSMYAVASTLAQARRMPGVIFSFEHDGGWTKRGNQANRPLFTPYYSARRKPWMMRALLRQRAQADPTDPANIYWGRR